VLRIVRVRQNRLDSIVKAEFALSRGRLEN
jgi:hypothetical protein